MLAVLRRTFGGPRLQVEDHKAATLRSRIMPMPLPGKLILPLPAALEPTVEPGQQVEKNQLLAGEPGEYGRRLHAPTSGRVLSIAPQAGPDDRAQAERQLILEVDHQDKGSDLAPLADHQALHQHEILERIAQAGVICTGPAQAGAAAKLAQGRSKQVRLIIINAAESEPYLCADEALLREHAALVVQGAALLQQAAQADRSVIAIQRGKPAALAALREALVSSGVEIALLPANDYPQGTDPQVIKTITGQEVRSGALPEDLGVLLFSASDAAAVCKAVSHGQVHTSRVVALAGQALRTPKCFVALMGTPIDHLLALTGCITEQHVRTVIGGTLRGRTVADLQTPISVNTPCVIAMSAAEIPAAPEPRDCIRCGDCLSVCPIQLQPQLLLELNREQQDLALLANGMADCIQCGACSHVCPSAIDLATHFEDAQQRLSNRAQQQQLSQYWQTRFQFHQYRLKRDRDQAQDLFAAPAAAASDKATESASNTGTDTGFSRDQARADIAAAVARVRARRKTRNTPDQDGSA